MPYHAPDNVTEALGLLRDGQMSIIAGCTDFLPALQDRTAPDNILDITRIEGLRGINITEEGWRIGAATTWTDVLKADLPPAFDALRLAAREVGSTQIQNRGTLAGNLCNASPAADGAPPLLALDTQVEIASATGSRVIPLSDFLKGVRKVDLTAGEMVTALIVPPIDTGARSSFLKLGSRTHLVISIAMAAAVITLRDGCIAKSTVAVGSCAPTARRLTALEDRVKGMSPTQLALADLTSADLIAPLSPISDVRGSAEYRVDVVPELCRRALLRAMGGG